MSIFLGFRHPRTHPNQARSLKPKKCVIFYSWKTKRDCNPVLYKGEYSKFYRKSHPGSDGYTRSPAAEAPKNAPQPSTFVKELTVFELKTHMEIWVVSRIIYISKKHTTVFYKRAWLGCVLGCLNPRNMLTRARHPNKNNNNVQYVFLYVFIE